MSANTNTKKRKSPATAAESESKRQSHEAAPKRRRAAPKAESQQKKPRKRKTAADKAANETKEAAPAHDLVITNTVCTCRLNQPLVLSDIVLALRGYREKFPSTVVQVRKPKATVNVFNSSKMVISGTDSLEAANCVAWKMCTILTKVLGRPFRVHDFQVENIVASYALGFCLDRDLLYKDFQSISTFEPHNISLITIRPFGQWPAFNMFGTGCGIFFGGRHPDQLEYAKNCIDFTRYKLGSTYRTLDAAHRKTTLTASNRG